jgi:histone deacetylase 6
MEGSQEVTDRDEDVAMSEVPAAGEIPDAAISTDTTTSAVEVNGHVEFQEAITFTDPMDGANQELLIADVETIEPDPDSRMSDGDLDQSQPSSRSPRPGLSLSAMPDGTLHGAGAVELDDTTSTSSTSSNRPLPTPTDSVKINTEIVAHTSGDAALPYASKKTGLVYDARMRWHTELGASDDDIHPEDPRRIYEIFHELVEAGLVESEGSPPPAHESFRLHRIAARSATAAEVSLVHTKEHFDWVESLEDKSVDELLNEGRSQDSVYLHQLTFFCAKLAAGGAIEACRAVVANQVKNAIAVIRPPGHHAEHDRAGGFCFFNNVCVASRVCQKEFPDICRRVLILDWDVHHGNGIQNIFEDDPNVLYISLHVHRDGNFYPNGPQGNHLHVGTGTAAGKNINIPWPAHYMGDGDYLYAFQQIVMPVAQEFNPDLVVIAAGFDAAEGDALGMCHVSPAGYSHMTHMLMSLASGKVVACLEGGYNLRSIAKSAVAVTRTLMGEPPERLYDIEPSANGVATVQLVIGEHSKYWKCLYPKEALETRLTRMGGNRLHDILRESQRFQYYSKFRMGPLHILRNKTSKSFENEVLAT